MASLPSSVGTARWREPVGLRAARRAVFCGGSVQRWRARACSAMVVVLWTSGARTARSCRHRELRTLTPCSADLPSSTTFA